MDRASQLKITAILSLLLMWGGPILAQTKHDHKASHLKKTLDASLSVVYVSYRLPTIDNVSITWKSGASYSASAPVATTITPFSLGTTFAVDIAITLNLQGKPVATYTIAANPTQTGSFQLVDSDGKATGYTASWDISLGTIVITDKNLTMLR